MASVVIIYQYYYLKLCAMASIAVICHYYLKLCAMASNAVTVWICGSNEPYGELVAGTPL